MARIEDEIQMDIIKECRILAHKNPDKYKWLGLVHASLNGAKFGEDKRKAAMEAGKQISMGMLPGMPDLCLPLPKNGNGALYIELKSKRGELSPDQARIIPLLIKAGNVVRVIGIGMEKQLTIDAALTELKNWAENA